MRRFFQQHYQSIISVLVFGLFVGLTIFVNNVHEPWRDEAEPWVVARNIGLLDLLLTVPGYLGTPMLWHLLLKPFAILGLPYITMHVIHGILACGVVAFILRFAPFPLWIRTLLPFSYYLAYEYNAIGRSYVLIVLFLLLIAHLYRDRWKRPMKYQLLIILLSQTASHGAMLAGVFFLAFVYEIAVGERNQRRSILSATATFFVLTLTIIQLWPPVDLAAHLSNIDQPSFIMVLQLLNQHPVLAFLPATFMNIHFWNGFRLLPLTDWFPLGYLLLLFVGWYFWKSSLALRGIVLSGFVLIEGLFLLLYLPAQRHAGLLFFFFLACFWIDARERTVPKVYQWAAWAFLAFVLCIQIMTAFVAVSQEKRFVFSAAELAAEHITGSREDTTLILYPSYIGIAAVPFVMPAYTEFYSLEQQRMIEYIKWDADMVVNMDPNDTSQRLQQAINGIQTSHVLLLIPNTHDEFLQELQYEKIWEYTEPTIIWTEQFVVYRVR